MPSSTSRRISRCKDGPGSTPCTPESVPTNSGTPAANSLRTFAAGVSLAGMVAEARRPLFLVVWLCMWLTAATELGPGQWVANIFNEVLERGTRAGIILLVWVNGIMYLMRQSLGAIPRRVSPTLLIACTAPIAAVGLFLFGQTDTTPMWFLAATLLAVGTAFWWPTMLGITSERFPAGGALLPAVLLGIFVLIYLADRTKGGYRVERLPSAG